jgi:hypothetical protein
MNLYNTSTSLFASPKKETPKFQGSELEGKHTHIHTNRYTCTTDTHQFAGGMHPAVETVFECRNKLLDSMYPRRICKSMLMKAHL